MAIQLVKPQKMNSNDFINEYVVDDETEVNDINIDAAPFTGGKLLMGSGIYVINTGNTYILNSNKEWRSM